MMLKILVADEWEFFDGFDRVSHREIPPDEDTGVRSDCLSFCERQRKDTENPRKAEIELWLYKGGQVVKQIIALRPIFILNNEGKTVERI